MVFGGGRKDVLSHGKLGMDGIGSFVGIGGKVFSHGSNGELGTN